VAEGCGSGWKVTLTSHVKRSLEERVCGRKRRADLMLLSAIGAISDVWEQ
jgi:hypothetical protein